MKQLGKFLMTSVLFLLAVPANAHMAGGEIGWEYLGKDTLKVIVRGYRDCNGVYMSNVPITLRSSCGTKTLSTSIAPLYSSIFVYPNPSSGVLHVEGLKGAHGYRLVGISGQTLLQGEVHSLHSVIDASSLTNGIYFLSIDDNPIQKIFISRD